MSMRWSMGSVRIRWRLAAISRGNCIGVERHAIGGFAALSRRSSLATQHRLLLRVVGHLPGHARMQRSAPD